MLEPSFFKYHGEPCRSSFSERIARIDWEQLGNKTRDSQSVFGLRLPQEQSNHQQVGGGVWESNPPFNPRRTESAVKAVTVTEKSLIWAALLAGRSLLGEVANVFVRVPSSFGPLSVGVASTLGLVRYQLSYARPAIVELLGWLTG